MDVEVEVTDFHDEGRWCWCHPTLVFELVGGVQVWKHRRLEPEAVASRVLFINPDDEDE